MENLNLFIRSVFIDNMIFAYLECAHILLFPKT